MTHAASTWCVRGARVTLATFAVLAVVSPTAAHASCMPPLELAAAIEQADVVVVGTVTATTSRSRIATLDVDEVWKGDVGATFEVAGGARGDVASTVDRTYESGTRYLLFA